MNENNNREGVLQAQDVMSEGYGSIPKMPMRDMRLTPEAKVIYAYLCSYAGSGSTAFPSRSRILRELNMSENRYYKHFGLLKEYGYITVSQNANKTGKFRNNIYTLIKMIPSYPQNGGTVKHAEKPYLQNESKPYLQNEITKRNNLKNNNDERSKSKSDSPLKKIFTLRKRTKTAETKKDNTDMTLTTDITTKTQKDAKKEKSFSTTTTSKEKQEKQKIKRYKHHSTIKSELQAQICYSDLIIKHADDTSLVDELLNCMLDVVCGKWPTVKIAGEDKDRELVKSQYLQLGYDDIVHVLAKYKEQTHKIRHVHAYLKTMLYNCKQEGNHYRTNAACGDAAVADAASQPVKSNKQHAHFGSQRSRSSYKPGYKTKFQNFEGRQWNHELLLLVNERHSNQRLIEAYKDDSDKKEAVQQLRARLMWIEQKMADLQAQEVQVETNVTNHAISHIASNASLRESLGKGFEKISGMFFGGSGMTALPTC